MNRQNTIMHTLKKCKKVKTYEQFLEIHQLICDNGYLWDCWINRCDNCDYDDFGQCLLNDISDAWVPMEHCLHVFIEKLEKEVTT